MNPPLIIHYVNKKFYNYITSLLIYVYTFFIKFKSEKTLTLIVGMHRSGTSAIAGSFYYSGVSMGEGFSTPKIENPKGFFELRKMVHVHQKIMNKYKLDWYTLKSSNDIDVLNKKLSRDLVKLIYKLMSENDSFVLKDPRLALFLKSYKKIADRLGITLKILFVKREVDKIVKSLNKRESLFDLSNYDFQLLTKVYIDNIEKEIKDVNKTFVIPFEQFISNLELSMSEIYKFVEDKSISTTALNKVKDFIEPRLIHN